MKFFPKIVVGAFALALFGCAPPRSHSGSRESVPKSFVAFIGDFQANSYQVELNDGVLDYETYSYPGKSSKARITPTKADWETFRRALDDLNVWSWRREYELTALDGTQWSLEIEYVDRSLKSEGSNNYPTTLGVPNGSGIRTEEFKRYLVAVQKLLGGRDFK
jgi:hypothetical protein